MKQVGYKEGNVKELQADVTGCYIIKHPLFVINRPRLVLYRKDDNGKVEGEIRWLGFKKKLKLDKHKENYLVFQFQVDIITIEVVIKFNQLETFEGFMDTPVGDFRFTGKKVVSS